MYIFFWWNLEAKWSISNIEPLLVCTREDFQAFRGFISFVLFILSFVFCSFEISVLNYITFFLSLQRMPHMFLISYIYQCYVYMTARRPYIYIYIFSLSWISRSSISVSLCQWKSVTKETLNYDECCKIINILKELVFENFEKRSLRIVLVVRQDKNEIQQNAQRFIVFSKNSSNM